MKKASKDSSKKANHQYSLYEYFIDDTDDAVSNEDFKFIDDEREFVVFDEDEDYYYERKKDCDKETSLRKLKPVEIKEKFLDGRVFGQEEAKKAVSMLLWSHFRGNPRNLLLVGPSGSGKTELFRAIKDSVYKNIYIFDASNVTETGWSGDKKLNTVFMNMLSEGFDKKEIENSIIVFDEFDKLIIPKHNSQGENVSMGVQGELLSMVEGGMVSLQKGKTTVDTTNISFVFLGAFENLYKKKAEKSHAMGFGSDLNTKENLYKQEDITVDDIMSFGLRTELAGRIDNVAVLKELDRDALYKILCHRTISPIRKIEKQYKMRIHVSAKLKKKIANSAYEKKLGARYLKSELQRLIDDKIYEGECEDDCVNLN